MANRTDADYEIEALTKGIKVIEALKGIRWEPVTVPTIMERTGFNRDLCDRTLKTLRLHGYATCEKGKWTAGKRLISIAGSIYQSGL
jgi:DNA-binding IclR family transcriptional regulator